MLMFLFRSKNITSSQFLLQRACNRWFPDSGSSLVRKAISRTPSQLQFKQRFTSVFASKSDLFLTSSTLILTPAQPGFSNHGLETRMPPDVGLAPSATWRAPPLHPRALPPPTPAHIHMFLFSNYVMTLKCH